MALLAAISAITLSVSALEIPKFTPVTPNSKKTNGIASQTNKGTDFNQQQIKQIKQIIHDYLVQNPQVLVEASKALQEKQMARQQAEALKAIAANKVKLFNNPSSPTVGNPNGKVILVEFFDYQCGHCKAMNQVVQDVIKDNKNLKVIFKELPIFGDNSQYAAKAALAAANQNKYYQFHDALLATSNPLTKQKVMQAAKKVGLNVKKLKDDINSQQINQQLRDNFQLAQQLKLIGTPAFIVANNDLTQFRFIPGATSAKQMQNLINSIQQTGNSNNNGVKQNGRNSIGHDDENNINNVR